MSINRKQVKYVSVHTPGDGRLFLERAREQTV